MHQLVYLQLYVDYKVNITFNSQTNKSNRRDLLLELILKFSYKLHIETVNI